MELAQNTLLLFEIGYVVWLGIVVAALPIVEIRQVANGLEGLIQVVDSFKVQRVERLITSF